MVLDTAIDPGAENRTEKCAEHHTYSVRTTANWQERVGEQTLYRESPENQRYSRRDDNANFLDGRGLRGVISVFLALVGGHLGNNTVGLGRFLVQ